MTHENKGQSPFTGFGVAKIPKTPIEDGLFLLVIYRDGSLTATAHATERGAMESALDYLENEQEESVEGGALEDHYVRAQEFISDEGGVMEIVPSPLYGG